MTLFPLCILVLFIPGVVASGWDDFTNNLATDLAPLITLFGEQVTKQFLSESVNVLDDIIFALAPLGILTGVVSAIRIRGNSSLRAFIGRAQEGPGDAEQELLSCVSETTAELFNNGGIARIFGKPKILEVIVRRDSRDRSKIEIKPVSEALKETLKQLGKQALEPEEEESFNVPNLSLNKGIKRRGDYWFVAACFTGCILQTGVMVYSGLTVFTWPDSFTKNGSFVASYAFPFFMIGTTLLTAGLFGCAFLTERASKKYDLTLTDQEQIYWFQPGNQEVGDQVLEAFAAVVTSSKLQKFRYKKSVRDYKHLTQAEPLVGAVSMTMVGFVLQFVGLRALHSSVTLAQLGSTMIMSVIRASLRTQRMNETDNLLTADTSHTDKKRLSLNEESGLDWLTFHLQGIQSFCLTMNPGVNQRPLNPDLFLENTVGTRRRLGDLVPANWGGGTLKDVAKNLSGAIEASMLLIFSWSGHEMGKYEFPIYLDYNSMNSVSSFKHCRVTIDSDRQYGSVLESILGLCTWSNNAHAHSLQSHLYYRYINQDTNIPEEDIELIFRKWMFRDTKPELLSHKRLCRSGAYFGSAHSDPASNDQLLAIASRNNFEVLAAQDIFIQFIFSAIGLLPDLGGSNIVQGHPQNGFSISNTRLQQLADCFQTNKLGSEQEALVCMVPTILGADKFLDVRPDSSVVLKKITDYTDQDEWEKAYTFLQWLASCSNGSDLEICLHMAGLFALLGMEDSTLISRKLAFKQVRLLLSASREEMGGSGYLQPLLEGRKRKLPKRDWLRDFAMQLTYAVWYFSSGLLNDNPEGILRDCHVEIGCVPKEWIRNKSPFMLLNLHHIESNELLTGLYQTLDWAIANHMNAILYWTILRVILSKSDSLIWDTLKHCAEKDHRQAIRLFENHDVNVDRFYVEGRTVFCDLVVDNNLPAVQRLALHGADINGISGKVTPLILAVRGGHRQTVSFLLQKARVDMTDSSGMTALMWSATLDQAEITRMLLDAGANLELFDVNRDTALMFAVSESKFENLQLLINKGANIDHQNELRETALMKAVGRKQVSAVRLLLDKKADIQKRDIYGQSAIDKARTLGLVEIEDLLRRHLEGD